MNNQQIRVTQIDLNAIFNYMIMLVFLYMMFRMVGKALEPEKPFMLGGAKLPPGYKPLGRGAVAAPTEAEQLQEKKKTLESQGKEMARKASAEFVELVEGWQGKYATPMYRFKDPATGQKIVARDLEDLEWKLSVLHYKPEHHSSSPGQSEITPKEWREAEAMWEVTKEDAQKGEVAGVYLWSLVTRHYPDDKDKQVRLMGYMNELTKKYPQGRVPQAEAISSAEKWGVRAALIREFMEFQPEHHSMWLTPEQRKPLEEKYGAIAVRWAEEATRPSDLKGVETAAGYYSKKMKEALGLGHLSPELTGEQIMKLREVLGLPADVAQILKIHRETGYVV